MKKLFAVIAVIAILLCCLSSCSSNKKTEDNSLYFETVSELLAAIKYDPYKYANKEIQVQGTLCKFESDKITVLFDLSEPLTANNGVQLRYVARTSPNIDIVISDEILYTVAESGDYMTVCGIVKISDGEIYLDNCTIEAKEPTEETYLSFSDWSNAKHATESITQPLDIQPKPASGTILSGKEYFDSEITVTADSSSSYVVSLKTSSGTDRLSFFVRAGETVTVGVPAEYLCVYFACGSLWYGYGEGLMFGDETIYSKDDDLLDFTQYTWEYTLYPVYDGNFSETPSNEDEFFE